MIQAIRALQICEEICEAAHGTSRPQQPDQAGPHPVWQPAGSLATAASIRPSFTARNGRCWRGEVS